MFDALCPVYDWYEDPALSETPRRFASMILELTTGESVEWTTFESDADEMVIVRDIAFVALCEHHVVPFIGHTHIGYIPTGRILGLSKFARGVRSIAKGLWTQEELAKTIATKIDDELSPLGVGVVMEAEHLCMTIRGVQAPGTKTITSSMLGVFADHSRQARSEFLSLIRER
jgi:GTP cyclohydrolase I